MDAKQFLKEARELYAKEPKSGITHMPPPEWDYTLDGLKRIIGYYSDRTGNFINFFIAFLHVITLTERFTNPDAANRWADEVQSAIQKSQEDAKSTDWCYHWDLCEEYLCETVLKHIDEIAAISKKSHDEQDALITLVHELRKYPTITSNSSIGETVSKAISLYMDSIKAKADIDTYYEMLKLTDKLNNQDSALLDMIKRGITGKTLLLNDMNTRHGTCEEQLQHAILDSLNGKYVFWDHEEINLCRYMRIDGINMQTYGSDINLFLTGPSLVLDWGFSPLFNTDSRCFLSTMTKIDTKLHTLHVINFDELCKLVEKHTHFMLDYIKKLACPKSN